MIILHQTSHIVTELLHQLNDPLRDLPRVIRGIRGSSCTSISVWLLLLLSRQIDLKAPPQNLPGPPVLLLQIGR